MRTRNLLPMMKSSLTNTGQGQPLALPFYRLLVRQFILPSSAIIDCPGEIHDMI
jgi:hypothetical protein